MNDQSSRSHSVFTIKIEQRTSTAIENNLTKEHMVKLNLHRICYIVRGIYVHIFVYVAK